MDNKTPFSLDAWNIETIIALLCDKVDADEHVISYMREQMRDQKAKADEEIADLKETISVLREENAHLRAMVAKIERFANNVEADDE